MTELPVSVRLALWGSASLARPVADRPPWAALVRRCAPDAQTLDAEATAATLSAWADLGERVICPVLPRAGDLGGLPRGGPDLVGAAVDAGECVIAPALGAALVPALEEVGPPGDVLVTIHWHGYDCQPVPRHRLEGQDVRSARRDLATTLAESTRALERLDAAAWAPDGTRALAEAQLSADRERWGLPPGVEPSHLAMMAQAAAVASMCDLAVNRVHDSHSLAVTTERREILLRLRSAADRTLEVAATVAALSLAGLSG